MTERTTDIVLTQTSKKLVVLFTKIKDPVIVTRAGVEYEVAQRKRKTEIWIDKMSLNIYDE